MNDTTDAAALLAPLWKRKWLILAVAIVVAGATYLHYKRQPSVFSATTELNLASGSEEQGLLSGNQSKALNTHIVGDAATLITSNGVSEQVHALLRGPHGQPAQGNGPHEHSAQGKVRTSVSSSSDIITITTEAHIAKAAARLANAYAQVYIKRQRTAYLRALHVAIASTRRQLRRIEAQSPAKAHGGGAKGASTTSASAVIQAANLSSKLSQLEAELHASGVQQINPARPTSAALLSPMPKRNAIFGFVIGLALAALAALALARADRRLHGLAEVEQAFGTQVLAALPRTKNPIVRVDGRPAPAEQAIDPLWRMRAALQLGGVVQNGHVGAPRSILFLSPETGDGKSHLLAGLALVRSLAGERVAVVDADLRQPAQAQLMGVNGCCGLADVLAGTSSLHEALRTVPSTPGPSVFERPVASVDAAGVATAVRPQTRGSVSLLASETPAANAPAVIANRAVPELLRSLAEDFDCVLIDAPSPLQASDAMPLLNAVDGIVLVARLGYTRDIAAERLAQLLARSASAPVLGAVVNDVPGKELARFGISAKPGRRRGLFTRTRR